MSLQEKAKKIAHANKISEQEALKLAKEQEKHRLDILQPGDPLFNKVYGKKLAKEQRAKEQQEDKSREQWQDSRERKNPKRKLVL